MVPLRSLIQLIFTHITFVGCELREPRSPTHRKRSASRLWYGTLQCCFTDQLIDQYYKGRLRRMPEGQNESQSNRRIIVVSEDMALLTPSVCSAVALVLLAARARTGASSVIMPQMLMPIRSLHSSESTQLWMRLTTNRVVRWHSYNLKPFQDLPQTRQRHQHKPQGMLLPRCLTVAIWTTTNCPWLLVVLTALIRLCTKLSPKGAKLTTHAKLRK